MKHEYAFPAIGEGYNDPDYCQHGMTLRDWFAGQALAQYVVSKGIILKPELVASNCYLIADAMLNERDK